MESLKQTAIRYLSMKSTWLGLIAILTQAGIITLAPATADMIGTAGSTIAGLVAGALVAMPR